MQPIFTVTKICTPSRVCHDEWHRVVHNSTLHRFMRWKLAAHFSYSTQKDVSDGCEPDASNRYRDKLVMNRIDSRMTRQIFNFDNFWCRMGYQSIRICECGLVGCRVCGHILLFLPIKIHIIPFNFTEFWAEALCLSIRIQWCHLPSIHVRPCRWHRDA